MNTPTFFAWDNMAKYADGSISALNGQVVWALAGLFVDNPLVLPRDNLSSYADGTISVLNGGSNWAEDGEFIT